MPLTTDKRSYTGTLTSHLTLFLCIATVGLFLAWASKGRLDIISVADGQVIPSSRVQVVQHLEGGIVREILVREGEHVVAGQPLVILEQVVSGAGVEELQSRVVALRVEIIRLEALAGDKAGLAFPEALRRDHPELTAQADTLFKAVLANLNNELTAQRELIRQREHILTEITVRIRNARENLKLVEEQVALSEELLRDNLTTQYRHLGYLREAGELRSRIEEDESALAAARAALSESQAKLERIRSSARETAQARLRDARQELEEVTQRLRRYADSLERTVIRSPVGGVVKTLFVTTLGGVVGPGQAVADVVPTEDRLIIEARLPIKDIGYVREGQDASVRLAGREGAVFGAIQGTVIHVAPDSMVGQDGRVFYQVRVETGQDHFSTEDLRFTLYPGMAMLVHIHTGTRTVLRYLTEPFTARFSGALQER